MRSTPPAGHFPLHAFYPWIVAAGCSLFCCRCGAEGKAPLPKLVAEYNRAAEGFLAEHKHCQEAA